MMLYLDIETNWTHDKIWCCVVKEDDEFSVYTTASGLQERIDKADYVVGHNIITFDAWVLQDVWDVYIPLEKQIDTLVISRLVAERDKHSLASWGETLGFPKGDYTDFESGYCQEMLDYCKRDVDLTVALQKRLKEMSKDFSVTSIKLEHDVAAIIAEQQRNGFKLDIDKCNKLFLELEDRKNLIETDMQKIFPPIVEKRYHKKTGKPINDKVEIFNLKSRQQIASRLKTIGAKFTKKTEKGNAIVDEKVLKSLNMPEADRIAEYLLLQKRVSQVKQWFDHVGEDDRVRGRVITNGAITGRMTHLAPNMAQVPSIKAEYGRQCRDCWTVEDGNVLVGIDASGLELRMLAHYMNDEAYTKELLEGDIHTANQKAAGLETRDQAKTFIYALLYGAGATRIGNVVGGSWKQGNELIDRFMANMPSLGKLKADLRVDCQRGYITGLDGRKVRIRSEHAALNTTLQSAGAIVMKQALVLLDQSLKELGVYYKFVANIHDEWQIECTEYSAPIVGNEAVKAIRKVQDCFNLNCPLDGEYKIGKTWAETH